MVEVDMSQGDWEFGCMIMQECPDGNVDLHALNFSYFDYII
jgi:hypothetical protein